MSVRGSTLLALLAACSGPAVEALPPPIAPLADDLALEVLALPLAARKALEAHRAGPHVIADPARHTWGGSMALGDDGRWHLFHSSWERSLGFGGWLAHTDALHATAVGPEGPWEPRGVALADRGELAWCALSAHNVKVRRFEGRWWLYFIGTTVPEERRLAGGAPDEAWLRDLAATGYGHADWMTLRSAQRTGVAVADGPEGPWLRSPAPIVEPPAGGGPITTLTVNPAVARDPAVPAGRYVMLVKGDRPGDPRRRRNQAVAVASTPDGPFTVEPEPAIADRDTEDASLWYDAARRRWYATFHAHTYLGLITSEDGLAWRPAARPVLVEKDRAIRFEDGSTWVPDRLERPEVVLDAEGRPRWLLAAVLRGDRSALVVLPLAGG